jgi:Rrf2 family nitric oxide-sensitive transcriptional repressor
VEVTVAEIAQQYGISRNHLVKIVHRLSQLGYIQTTRGRSGGMHLAHPPQSIRLGDVIRDLETNRTIVECFNPTTNTCPIAPVCTLKGVLAEAAAAFQNVLDDYTIADLITNRDEVTALLLPGKS